jgi:abortive infection bacteriophage resistance protein
MEVLRGKGCVITDDTAAVAFLKCVNYYRLSGYFLAFKKTDGTFADGTSFDRVASIYTFDQKLRDIVAKAVREVELSAKSVIAYHHGHRYGSVGYLDAGNFNMKHDHERFTGQFEAAVQNNKGSLFVRHHLKRYDGKFPIWVAVELFTMGMVSLFYADLFPADKRAIAKEFNTDYKYLESWLHSSAVLRNLCAHHARLYNVKFHQNPKLPKEYAEYADMNERSLFKQLYMLKLLYSNCRDEWNDSIFSALSVLLKKHGGFLDLKTMGLPENWKNVLAWRKQGVQGTPCHTPLRSKV